MNPIRALLWKEGREILPFLLAITGLSMMVLLSRQYAPFNGVFSTDFLVWVIVPGIIGTLALGMGAVAGERSQGTLSFLLSRPLVPGRLLLVKFGIRAVALLLLFAALWWVVYAMPLVTENRHIEEVVALDARILADVGYSRMVLIWFNFYFVPFAFVFTGSALADSRTKAVVLGFVAWWGWLLVVLPLALLVSWVGVYFEYLFHIGFDGKLVQLAREPVLLAGQVGLVALLGTAAFGLAWWAVIRYRDSGVPWRTVLLVGSPVFLAMLFLLGGPSLEEEPDVVEPVGMLSYEAPAVDLALRDGQVFVALKEGMSVVDATAWDRPRQIGRAAAPDWTLQRIALAGSSAFVWGHFRGTGGDSAGIAVFDIGVPETPRLAGRTLLEPVRTYRKQEIPRLIDLAVMGEHLYAGVVDERYVSLLCFVLEGEDGPSLVKRTRIAAVEGWGPQVDFGLILRDGYAYFSRHGELVILNLADPSAPAELSRTLVQEYAWKPDRADKLLMLHGNRAYIRRSWPQEVAVLDIGDPARPVEAGALLWNGGYNQDAQTDGRYIYEKDWTELKTFKVYESGLCVEQDRLGLRGEEKNEERYARIVLTDEYVSTLLNNNLVFYAPLERH